ncbi:hypothetical protein Pfo_028756, partial [Paulownia fortunei]
DPSEFLLVNPDHFCLSQPEENESGGICLDGFDDSLCLAAPRRALVSSGRNNVGEEGVAENTNKEKISRAGHPDGAIDNHHNIPRQYYNQWGSSSNGGGDDGDNNGDGSG